MLCVFFFCFKRNRLLVKVNRAIVRKNVNEKSSAFDGKQVKLLLKWMANAEKVYIGYKYTEMNAFHYYHSRILYNRHSIYE